MTLGFPTKLVATSMQSRFLLFDVFEVDVLEILRQLVLYAMIDKLETSKRTK
jgi:hypothetical protein